MRAAFLIAFALLAGTAVAAVPYDRAAWQRDRLLGAGYAGGYSAGLPRAAYGSNDVATALATSWVVEALYGTWTGATYGRRRVRIYDGRCADRIASFPTSLPRTQWHAAPCGRHE